jgi:hypothetical protein
MLVHRIEGRISMTATQVRRLGAGVFTIASLGFLLETMSERDGPLVEIILGAVMAAVGLVWLT